MILSNDKSDIYNLIPSRLYQYFNSRRIESDNGVGLPICMVDDGCSLKSAYESLTKYKAIDENFYHDETKINVFPPPDIYKLAYQNHL